MRGRALVVTALFGVAACGKLFGIDHIPYAGDAGINGGLDAGVTGPRLLVGASDTTAYDFGTIAEGKTSAILELQISNVGDMATGALAIAPSGDSGDFTISADTCTGHALGAGTSCGFSVVFAPPTGEAPQLRMAALVVGDGTASVTANLSGTSITPGALDISPNLDFSVVPVATTSAEQTMTLRNTGSTPLDVTQVVITGASPADYAITGGSCAIPQQLAGGASCTVSLAFTPHIGGSSTATLQATTDAATNPVSTGPLGGTGSMLLTVSLTAGVAGPKISSSDNQISCGIGLLGCTATFKTATVPLVATLGGAKVFLDGWSEPGCAATASSCVVASNAASKTVSVSIPAWPVVTIDFNGIGDVSMQGIIAVDDATMTTMYAQCVGYMGAPPCSVTIPIAAGQVSANIAIVPNMIQSTALFGLWSGGCSSQDPIDNAQFPSCFISVSANTTIGAEYFAGAGDIMIAAVPSPAGNVASAQASVTVNDLQSQATATCPSGTVCIIHDLGGAFPMIQANGAANKCPQFSTFSGGGCGATSSCAFPLTGQLTVIDYKFTNAAGCP